MFLVRRINVASVLLIAAPLVSAFAPNQHPIGGRSMFKPNSAVVSVSPRPILPSPKTSSRLFSSSPVIDVEEMVKYVRQSAGEDVDVVAAEKAIREGFSSFTLEGIEEKVMRMKEEERAIEDTPQDACEEALFDFAIDAVGLLLSISGVPSKITKKVARKIVRKAWKKLIKVLKRIAKEYFKDATDLLKVAQGLAELASALMQILTLDFLIDAIFSEMSWWEIASLGTFIAAQVAIIFFSGGSALAIKLLMVAPAVVDLCLSAARVGTYC